VKLLGKMNVDEGAFLDDALVRRAVIALRCAA
jgi:hypothetical protein